MKILTTAIVSILLSVAAQFSLRAGMSSQAIKNALSEPFAIGTGITILLNKFILAGFLLYGLGAVIWLAVLSEWEVSKAYPLVGLGFAISVLIGYWFGEQITWERGFGVLLICCGVMVLSRS